MYIHNLNPVALEFYSIKIYWYSLAYFFGFLISISFSKFLIKKTNSPLTKECIDDFFIWAVLGVIIGGRLGYILFYNYLFYYNNPQEIFKIWNGGMAFHGGLIGLILSMLLFSKIKKVSFFAIANIISACAPIGIFLGRIANFINGELKGKKTSSDWGVIFDDGEPRYPSQLYEAFFEGLVLFFIVYFFLINSKLKKYNSCCIFLIFYGLFRFFLEFYREPDEQLGHIFLFFSMGQILSVPMVLLGLLFIKFKKYNAYS